MKTITNKIILLFCLVMLTLSTTSCLKDDPMFDWDASGSVIELPYNSHTVLYSKVTSAKNVEAGLMVNYTVSFAADNHEDIPVTLAAEESMVAEYNKTLSATTKKYVLLPASTYTLPGVVIKQGTQLWKETLVINTSTLKPGEKYLLPVKITGVPAGYTISGNFGHVYLRIDMAN